jgi:hypothetical protein
VAGPKYSQGDFLFRTTVVAAALIAESLRIRLISACFSAPA